MRHSRQAAGKRQWPHLGAMQGESCGCCLLKLLGVQGLHLLILVIVFSPAPQKANGVMAALGSHKSPVNKIVVSVAMLPQTCLSEQLH